MMKSLFVLLSLITVFSVKGQDTLSFRNQREMIDYAFEETTEIGLGTRFLADRTPELSDSLLLKYLPASNDLISAKDLLRILTWMEWWDVTHEFKRDSVLFREFDRLYALDGEETLNIPIFVVDISAAKMLPEVTETLRNNGSIAPYPSISGDDVTIQSIAVPILFLDSAVYNHIALSFSDINVLSTNSRQVIQIDLTANNENFTLTPETSYDITHWIGKEVVLSRRSCSQTAAL